MTLSSVITVLFHSLRPIISAVLSLILTLSSSLGGPMGDYLGLSAKTVKFGNNETTISYEISLNVNEADRLLAQYYGETELQVSLTELVSEISEMHNFINLDANGVMTLSDSFDVYTDPNNLRMVVESSKDDSLKIYADTSAVALSPELTEKVLEYMSEEELSAYKKHMDGKSFYFSVAEILGEDLQSAVGEIPKLEAEMIFNMVSEIAREFAHAITSENFTTAYTDMTKTVYENLSKYFSETEIDGSKGYKYRISGMDYINAGADIYSSMATEEFANSYVELVEILIASLGNTSLSALSGFPAKLPENEAEALRTQIFEALEELSVEYDALVALMKYEDGALSAYVPYLENSYIENILYEKDGKITSVQSAVISDGKTPLAEIEITAVYSDFGGIVPSPDFAVAFENRMTYELLDNKVGYEMAQEKGVDNIEIHWEAEMTPDTPLHTSSESFYVTYKTTFADSIYKNDALTEEEKLAMKELYEDELEYSFKDSSANVIDGSVYLPLRQLMENAGYEVSWDAELRKAYVTVGGEKIEMTGTIIDNKTYVKVRDFEKLGATVDYEEEIIYADAWNDFYKNCYVKITFTK